MKIMKQIWILFFIAITLYHCSTVKPVADKEYDFNQIKSVGIVKVSDFKSQKGSGNIVMNAVSDFFLKKNIKIATRKNAWTYLEEREYQMSGIQNSSDYPTVLIQVYIMEYIPEEKRLVPVTIKEADTLIITKIVETKIEKTENYSNKNVPKINKKILKQTEKEITEKKPGKTTHTFQMGYWEAKVSLHLRMIDVKSGKVIWISNSNYSAIDLNASLKGSVAELLIPFEVLVDS